MPDLTDLLDATTPTDLPPLDVPRLAHRARRRARHRRVAAVIGVTAVLLVASGAVTRTGTDNDPAIVTRQSEQDLASWLIGDDAAVDIVVFLRPDVTEAQLAGLLDYLHDYPRVTSTEHWDDEETMKEFQRVFSNNPAMLEEGRKNPDLAPNTLRIALADDASADEALALVRQLSGLPSVLRVVSTGEHQQPAGQYDYELVLHLDVGITAEQRTHLLATVQADARVEDVQPGNRRQGLADSDTYVVALTGEPGLAEVARTADDLRPLPGVTDVSAQ